MHFTECYRGAGFLYCCHDQFAAKSKAYPLWLTLMKPLSESYRLSFLTLLRSGSDGCPGSSLRRSWASWRVSLRAGLGLFFGNQVPLRHPPCKTARPMASRGRITKCLFIWSLLSQNTTAVLCKKSNCLIPTARTNSLHND